MIDNITKQLEDHIEVISKLKSEHAAEIELFILAIVNCYKNKNKLLVMGNGGSAADSQHFVAELVGRFKLERKALSAVALTTDTSIITAIGNDYGFETIFSRQIEALADKGDVVVGISTSGNSPNVLKALNLAKEIGCFTVSLLGKDGGDIKKISELPIIVPSMDTPRIQEAHATIIHLVCDLVEKELFK